MPFEDFVYQQSGLAIGLLFFAAMVVASEGGYWLGLRKRAGAREAAPESRGARDYMNAVQTAIFAVLGLLLAFTFSMVESRFALRKQALVDEIDAIGTAYLRTELLPEPRRTAAVDLLRRYVDARLASGRPDWYLDSGLKHKTDALQRQAFSDAVAAALQDPRAVTTGLYVQSLNDMIDSQGRRDAVRLDHLPWTAPFLLVAVSIMAISILGYRSGLSSGRSVAGTVVLSLLIALIVSIIRDLDRPYRGLITISEQSMIELRRSMGNGPPAP
jgi:hypothetical protein